MLLINGGTESGQGRQLPPEKNFPHLPASEKKSQIGAPCLNFSNYAVSSCFAFLVQHLLCSRPQTSNFSANLTLTTK